MTYNLFFGTFTAIPQLWQGTLPQTGEFNNAGCFQMEEYCSKVSFLSTAIHFLTSCRTNCCNQWSLILRLYSRMMLKWFPEWQHWVKGCCLEVWTVGSTADSDIWRTKAGQWEFLETSTIEVLERNATPQLQLKRKLEVSKIPSMSLSSLNKFKNRTLCGKIPSPLIPLTWMETTQQYCQHAAYSTQPVTTQNWIMKVCSNCKFSMI